MRAARYLGVAPWELLERPLAWTEHALAAEAAELEAEKHKQAQAERRNRRRN